MTCRHCAETVRDAVLGCHGVESVEVDLAAGRADVYGGQLDAALLCRSVEKAGYEAEVTFDARSPDGAAPRGKRGG
jgi:copper chaperone CopZ